MTTECPSWADTPLAHTATFVDPHYQLIAGSMPITAPKALYLDGTRMPTEHYRLTAGAGDHFGALQVTVRVPAGQVSVAPHRLEKPGCRHVEIAGVSCCTSPIRDWRSSVLDVDGELVLTEVEVDIYVGDVRFVRSVEEAEEPTPEGDVRFVDVVSESSPFPLRSLATAS
jgi:hypothetical protein